MIGHLHGRVLEKHPPFLILDVGGVGYEVEASMNTFYRLPEIGADASIYVHMVVREDAQLLYGFVDRQERSVFRELIKTNGVGPKLAITLLSGISVDAFVRCVEYEDVATLVKLPGVGKKTAERLIIEMKDRLKNLSSITSVLPKSSDSSLPLMETISPVVDEKREAEAALLALGYKPVQATKAVEAAAKSLGEQVSAEEIIRLALRGMINT
ncbi:MAG: Holliday junction branch migration protein RuvA [Nitrincola sp.]|nr:Holliday junction branch migration protein RuvA [Nitrincola sp.]